MECRKKERRIVNCEKNYNGLSLGTRLLITGSVDDNANRNHLSFNDLRQQHPLINRLISGSVDGLGQSRKKPKPRINTDVTRIRSKELFKSIHRQSGAFCF